MSTFNHSTSAKVHTAPPFGTHVYTANAFWFDRLEAAVALVARARVDCHLAPSHCGVDKTRVPTPERGRCDIRRP